MEKYRATNSYKVISREVDEKGLYRPVNIRKICLVEDIGATRESLRESAKEYYETRPSIYKEMRENGCQHCDAELYELVIQMRCDRERNWVAPQKYSGSYIKKQDHGEFMD